MAIHLWPAFSKLGSILPFVAEPFLKKGGEIIGKKVEAKVDTLFGLGEKSLGDEIACDDVVAELESSDRELFEEFMGWLEEQSSDGKKKANIIREVIFAKIRTKEVRQGGGKKGVPATNYTEHDYSHAVEFVERIIAQGDHGSMLRYLRIKNFFSVIPVKKESLAKRVSENETVKKVGGVVKTEAIDGRKAFTQSIDNLASWLDSKKKKEE